MTSLLSAKRKNDALMIVQQDNPAHTLLITQINEAVEKLTGFTASELADKPLNNIVPARIKEMLDDYVEFTDPSADFASVVRRIPNFQIVNKQGKEVPVSLKVFYLASEDIHKPEFEVLMRDITLIQRMEELKGKLQSLQKDEKMAENVAIPSAHLITAGLELCCKYVSEDPVDISIVLLAIDNYDQYTKGKPASVGAEIIRTIAGQVQQICRDEDIIGYLGGNTIGLILADCNEQNAQSVLKRVNTGIARKPLLLDNGDRIQPTLSILYKQITPQDTATEALALLTGTLPDVQAAGGNRLHKV